MQAEIAARSGRAHLVAGLGEAEVDARCVQRLAHHARLFDDFGERLAVHADIAGAHITADVALAKHREREEDLLQWCCRVPVVLSAAVAWEQ